MGPLRVRPSRERYRSVVDELLTICEREGERKTP